MVAAVKKSSARSIVCSKTLVALPGEEDRVLAMCQEVAAFSQEAMKERSKGIIEYNCSQVRLQWTCSTCSGGPPSRQTAARPQRRVVRRRLAAAATSSSLQGRACAGGYLVP